MTSRRCAVGRVPSRGGRLVPTVTVTTTLTLTPKPKLAVTNTLSIR